jgi:alkylation response protein AidB-like acyl-CoA dehydrogenase
VILDLTSEQRLLVETVREFARARIAPIASAHDESGEFPWDTVREMADLGLFGVPFPEEYGGAGADALSLALVVEELARWTPRTRSGQGHTSSALADPRLARPNRRSGSLPPGTGRVLGAFGLTEATSGPTPRT